MAGEEILVNYEGLKKIIDLFSLEAEKSEQMISKLTQQVEALHVSGFIGKASDTFHSEMESLVFPGLKRLENAMWFSQNSLREIVQVFQQAEDEAKNLFKPQLGNTDATIENNELFKMGKNDKKLIHPNDISQGSLGDCYLMAALAALANDNPGAIEEMITINPDGTYRVRFFNEETGNAEYVNVERKDIKLDRRGNPIYAEYGDDTELWPAVIEKAYAKWIDERNIRDPWWSRSLEKIGFEGKNDYKLIEGGLPGEALRQITGRQSNYFFPASDITEQDLIHSLQENSAITIGTLPEDDPRYIGNQLYKGNPATLVKGHAYYITGYDKSTGMVEIRNPWGFDHKQGVVYLSLSELKYNITHFAIN